MTATAAPRWVVFATFSPTGRRATHVLDQLAEYRAIGFQVLVVDASPVIGAERRADWDRLATRWMQRQNVGYDFASWRAGCDAILAQGVALDALHLILTNDSCFGPYFSIAEVLARFAAMPPVSNPVYGMTDSRETSHYHLQSYWMYFPPGPSGLAIRFLRGMPLAADRDAAIRDGELALSEQLQQHGCTLVAYAGLEALIARCARRPYGDALSLLEFAVRRVLRRYRYTRRGDGACIKYLLRRPGALDYVNPTLDFGRFLFRSAWMPFVKVMLIRDNPSGDPDLPARTAVDTMTNEEAAEILRPHH